MSITLLAGWIQSKIRKILDLTIIGMYLYVPNRTDSWSKRRKSWKERKTKEREGVNIFFEKDREKSYVEYVQVRTYLPKGTTPFRSLRAHLIRFLSSNLKANASSNLKQNASLTYF